MADATIARNPVVHKEWDYTAGLVLLGMERLGPKYAGYIKQNIDAFVGPDGSIKTYEMDEFNLDQINEGRVLFGLYSKTKDKK